MNVVFLGAPGAGKGTQVSAVALQYGLVHISTGELLREAVRQGTDLGKRAQVAMEKGELVSDDLVVDLVVDRLSRADAAGGALLDGFPRNIYQAKALDEALRLRDGAVDMALFFRVPEASLLTRLTGRRECGTCRTPYHTVTNPPLSQGVCDRCGGELVQRADDLPETVSRRLKVYLEQTEPLLGYYRTRGLLSEVNGDRPIPEVTHEVMAVLAARGMV